MKKCIIAVFLCLVSFWVYAQEGLPIQPEFSSLETPESTASEFKKSFFMGLWLELASNNTFLIRDIATGEKAGFEFNRAAIYTKANWWFWAELSPVFVLDGEIGLWEAEIQLYQANSFGANVPDTTIIDGFQGLAAVIFAPIFNLNGQTVGGFNKLGFNINTPYVNTRFGYGLLKGGGMSEFTGIFNILDRWDNVGRGYTELTLGDRLTSPGDKLKLNFLAGFSRMRAEYGVYSLFGMSILDTVDFTAGFGSTTNSGELFRYNEQNENAASFYVSYKPLDFLKIAVHGLTTFGTDIDSGFVKSSAAAFQALGEIGIYSWDFVASIAGAEARTVWGDDNSVSPDTLSLSLVQWFNLKNGISIGLDTGMSNYNTGDFSAGLFNLRNQPMLDINLGSLAGQDMSLSLYGVLQLDRIAVLVDADQPWSFRFEEAGVELTMNNLPFMKKLVFNYAALAEYNEWDNGYDINMLYNSIMLSGDINDSISLTLGSVIRSLGSHKSPLGFAAGVSIKTKWKGGAPLLWAHVTYGMDPYEDNAYTLFRADDPVNKPGHRTFMLNRVNDYVDKARFSLGLIWEL